MTIKLPMDVEIEMNTRLPYDFDDIIRKIFNRCVIIREPTKVKKSRMKFFHKRKFFILSINIIQ